jgi:hypothetical protein
VSFGQGGAEYPDGLPQQRLAADAGGSTPAHRCQVHERLRDVGVLGREAPSLPLQDVEQGAVPTGGGPEPQGELRRAQCLGVVLAAASAQDARGRARLPRGEIGMAPSLQDLGQDVPGRRRGGVLVSDAGAQQVDGAPRQLLGVGQGGTFADHGGQGREGGADLGMALPQ